MRIDLAFFVREKVTEYLLPPSFFCPWLLSAFPLSSLTYVPSFVICCTHEIQEACLCWFLWGFSSWHRMIFPLFHQKICLGLRCTDHSPSSFFVLRVDFRSLGEIFPISKTIQWGFPLPRVVYAVPSFAWCSQSCESTEWSSRVFFHLGILCQMVSCTT